jgi:hypothetical protein
MSRHSYRTQTERGADATVQFEVPGIDHSGGPARPSGWQAPGRTSRASSGWPLLADDLFQIMHDDGNAPGRLRTSPRTAALGLAGALLAELAFAERIALRGDTVTVIDVTAPPDVAAHLVLADIAGEVVEHPVSTWVHYLADTAYRRVAHRLVRRGRIREEVHLRWLRRTSAFVPVDLNQAAWPAARLSTQYVKGRLHTLDCVLSGLVCAVGLQHHVFFDLAEHELAAVPNVLEMVPPPLPALVRLVHATVGQAVMAAR